MNPKLHFRFYVQIFTLFAIWLNYGCQNSSHHRYPGAIFLRDDRIKMARDLKIPVGSVHRSKSNDIPWGTGFLVDPCHFLTSFHLIGGKHSNQIYFEINRPLSDQPGKRILAVPVLYGPKKLTSVTYDVDQDWALLKLKQCLPKGVAIFQMRTLSLANQSNELTLQNAGFPQDRSLTNCSVDPKCRLQVNQQSQQDQQKIWKHDCATRPGNSGSPIYYQNKNGQYIVIAMTILQKGDVPEVFQHYDNFYGNGAIPGNRFIPQVTKYLSLVEKGQVRDAN